MISPRQAIGITAAKISFIELLLSQSMSLEESPSREAINRLCFLIEEARDVCSLGEIEGIRPDSSSDDGSSTISSLSSLLSDSREDERSRYQDYLATSIQNLFELSPVIESNLAHIERKLHRAKDLNLSTLAVSEPSRTYVDNSGQSSGTSANSLITYGSSLHADVSKSHHSGPSPILRPDLGLGKTDSSEISFHQCPHCSKRFSRAYNLRSHLRTHIHDKPFVCTVCGRRCSAIGRLYCSITLGHSKVFEASHLLQSHEASSSTDGIFAIDDLESTLI